MRFSLRALLCAAAAVLTATTSVAMAQAPREGRIGPDLGITGNGRMLEPAGRLSTLGNFPTGGAVTPDGRFYWAVNAGHGANSVNVVEVATGAIAQTLPLPGAYVGVAFSPDGRSAYVSGAAKGTSMPAGPTKGDGGDVIHTFAVDPASGKGTEGDLIQFTNANQIPAGGRARTSDNLGNTQKAYPEGLAVSPDAKTLVVALNQADQVAIVDLASKSSRFVRVGEYPYTAAVTADSKTAYVSNELSGTISVVDLAGGRVSATIPVGGPPGDPRLGGPLGDFNAHPQGMVLDPKRPVLYVAVANRDLVAVVDTKQNKTVSYVNVGRAPALGTSPVDLAITPDGSTLYSANANEDALAAIALTARTVPATPARAATPGTAAQRGRSVYLNRSITRILRYRKLQSSARASYRRSLRSARTPARRRAARRSYARRLRVLRTKYVLGLRRNACAGPTRVQDRRYAQTVLKAETKRSRALARAKGSGGAARRRRAAARRAFTRTVAAARRRLPARRVCRAGTLPTPASPATPERRVEALSLIGRIPTAAYPQDVEVTRDGKLVWLAGKGLGAGPNRGGKTIEGGGQGEDPGGEPDSTEYVLQKLIGRAGVLQLPSDAEIAGLHTPAADRHVIPQNFKPAPSGTPVVGPGGGPSDKIKYVFYVVRENRTYDQVFGSEPRGDGDPKRQLFDDNTPCPVAATCGVTPNSHALAKRFPLMDHVYANSEVSIDGHIITTGGYAIDYVQKSTAQNYSDRGRAFDFGLFNVTLAPNFSAFDQAARQGLPFRFYGEASAGTFEGNAAKVNENGFRPTGEQVQDAAEPGYPSQATYGCVAGTPPCFYDSGTFGGTTKPADGTPQTSRLDTFRSRFEQQLASNSVPRFNYLTLPNDHTNGTRAGTNTPAALVADNDLAVGQLVELISKSKIWNESAIFVIQDDTQAGPDSVDAHRMPAFVISPWAKKAAVVSTRYDQYSALRTAMLILGLRPLSLNDAFATPMYDVFDNGPQPLNTGEYEAIQPQQNIMARNGVGAPRAKFSAALPYERQDVVPQAISDRILWASVFGDDSKPPPPGPNASPIEVDRGEQVLRIWRNGGDVAEWLERYPGPEGEEEEEEEEEAAGEP